MGLRVGCCSSSKTEHQWDGTSLAAEVILASVLAQVLGLPAVLGGTSTWPLMLGVVLPVALLQLPLQPTLLESPRWFAMYGLPSDVTALFVKGSLF